MTQLHAGGKFDHDLIKYQVDWQGWSFGVNALSENLKLSINREGKIFYRIQKWRL